MSSVAPMCCCGVRQSWAIAVEFFIAGGQDEDRTLIIRPYLPTDSKTVRSWQIDIKHYRIGLEPKDSIDGSVAMPFDFNAEVVLLQKRAHDLGKLQIIFDQ